MIYEKETFRRCAPPIPEAFRIFNIKTGKIYETLSEAARSAGVSNYKMRKFIADGTTWSRPSGSVHSKKEVRCVTTGEVFPSAVKAFEIVPSRHAKPGRRQGKNINSLYAHLSGQTKSIKGLVFEYTGNAAPRKQQPKRTHRRKKDAPVRDDAGRVYRNVNCLARESGYIRERVEKLLRLDPEGIFRTAWVNDRKFRIARHDGKWWWVNGSIPADTIDKFRAVLRLMGHRDVVKTGDLFA